MKQFSMDLLDPSKCLGVRITTMEQYTELTRWANKVGGTSIEWDSFNSGFIPCVACPSKGTVSFPDFLSRGMSFEEAQVAQLTYPRTMLVRDAYNSTQPMKPATVFYNDHGVVLYTYREIDKLGPRYGHWVVSQGSYAEELHDEFPMDIGDITKLVHNHLSWFCDKSTQDNPDSWFSNPILCNNKMYDGRDWYCFDELVYLHEAEYFDLRGTPKCIGKPLTKVVD